MEKRFLVGQLINGGDAIVTAGKIFETLGQAVEVAQMTAVELNKPHLVFLTVASVEPVTAPVTAKVSYL